MTEQRYPKCRWRDEELGLCGSPRFTTFAGKAPYVKPEDCIACSLQDHEPDDEVRAALIKELLKEPQKLRMSIKQLAEAKKNCIPCREVPQRISRVQPARIDRLPQSNADIVRILKEKPLKLSTTPVGSLRWMVGVTTCEERRYSALPPTVESLRLAGFDAPRLFADGVADPETWEEQFGLELTTRYPKVLIFANWILAIHELYLRDPFADRYALFQDDLIAVRNLRQYLDATPWIENSYLNLLTYTQKTIGDNEKIIRGKPYGWYEASLLPKENGGQVYHGKQQQVGVGAVALVFDNPGVQALLSHPHMVKRVRSEYVDKRWRKVDGAIVETMNQSGFREYIHNPSLVQHTGVGTRLDPTTGREIDASTIRIQGDPLRVIRQAKTFPGEDFDALSLVGKPVEVTT